MCTLASGANVHQIRSGDEMETQEITPASPSTDGKDGTEVEGVEERIIRKTNLENVYGIKHFGMQFAKERIHAQNKRVCPFFLEERPGANRREIHLVNLQRSYREEFAAAFGPERARIVNSEVQFKAFVKYCHQRAAKKLKVQQKLEDKSSDTWAEQRKNFLEDRKLVEDIKDQAKRVKLHKVNAEKAKQKLDETNESSINYIKEEFKEIAKAASRLKETVISGNDLNTEDSETLRIICHNFETNCSTLLNLESSDSRSVSEAVEVRDEARKALRELCELKGDLADDNDTMLKLVAPKESPPPAEALTMSPKQAQSTSPQYIKRTKESIFKKLRTIVTSLVQIMLTGNYSSLRLPRPDSSSSVIADDDTKAAKWDLVQKQMKACVDTYQDILGMHDAPPPLGCAVAVLSLAHTKDISLHERVVEALDANDTRTITHNDTLFSKLCIAHGRAVPYHPQYSSAEKKTLNENEGLHPSSAA